jgi:hypothetical protein
MNDLHTMVAPPAPALSAQGRRITFAACVEYGTLEEGTIRLVESLRRYGGDFSGARFVAVTPRNGAPLQRSTLRRFKELDVDYVRISPRNRYVWQPYLNKYFALKEAEKRATGDLVAWVDSDVLVLRPPTEMLLDPDQDFGACPRDKNLGSRGPGDEHEAYWQKLCGDVGLTPDSLPWVTTTTEAERIRLYWNAGIFVYRPASGFLEAWRQVIERVLDKSDASTLVRAYWTDQVSLGLAAVLKKLRLAHWGGDLNYGIATHFKDHLSTEGLRTATLLHFHDSMKPENWSWFLDNLRKARPEVSDWLRSKGPVEEPRDAGRQMVKDGYRVVRQLRRRLWLQSHGGSLLQN